MDEMPFVHVVMTCWNRISATQKALAALLDITQYPSWAVTVIDDASTDQTYKWLSSEVARRDNDGRASFTLIRHDKQLGTNVSSNEGWQMADGWYCKFDNNALVLKPDWLTQLVELALALGSFYAGIVAHNLEPGPPDYPVIAMNGRSHIVKQDNVCGKCALIPEWTRARLGYWNTNIGTPYRGADVLMGTRIKLTGTQNVYVPLNNTIRRLTDAESGETRDRSRWRQEMKRLSRVGVRALTGEYESGARPLDDWSSAWN